MNDIENQYKEKTEENDIKFEVKWNNEEELFVLYIHEEVKSDRCLHISADKEDAKKVFEEARRIAYLIGQIISDKSIKSDKPKKLIPNLDQFCWEMRIATDAVINTPEN